MVTTECKGDNINQVNLNQVNKKEAKEQTVRKFTNLLDGKILLGISVSKVLDYYESLIVDAPIGVVIPGNIEQRFIQEEINQIVRQQEEELNYPY